MVSTDRFKYGYDRDGNVLYRTNELNHAFDELYHANGASNGYDNLNQLTDFRRGTLTDANSDGVPDTVSTASRTQSWSFDALGNWSSVTSDGTTQNRTANKQNEITSITSLTTPTYDSNGNMTADENGKTLIYDAWNRLVASKNGTTTLESLAYDALNRRIIETAGTALHLYFSSGWQVLEERSGGSVQTQNSWSPVYLDALLERDQGSQRLYAQQDANWDTTSLLDAANGIVQRYVYDSYGSALILNSSWGTSSFSTYDLVYLRQGGRFDPTMQLYDFRHRDLSPTLGRWIQDDPLKFRGHDDNLYRFLRAHPLRGTDPTGLQQVGGGPVSLPPNEMGPPQPVPSPPMNYWLDGRWDGRGNTVVCGRNGQPTFVLSPLNGPCLRNCIIEHEKSHLMDIIAANPNICAGLGNDDYPTLIVSDEATTNASEAKAYNAEIECLKTARAKCPRDCIDEINERLNDMRKELARGLQNGFNRQ